MKNIKIKTEKVTFYVIDMPVEVQNIYLNGISWQSRDGELDTWHEGETLTFVSFLKDISEEQASEIVESHKNCKRYYYEKSVPQTYYNSALDCLHSLLRSKGIFLFENPFNIEYCFNPKYYSDKFEAETKTFYNPAIYAVVN